MGFEFVFTCSVLQTMQHYRNIVNNWHFKRQFGCIIYAYISNNPVVSYPVPRMIKHFEYCVKNTTVYYIIQ